MYKRIIFIISVLQSHIAAYRKVSAFNKLKQKSIKNLNIGRFNNIEIRYKDDDEFMLIADYIEDLEERSKEWHLYIRWIDVVNGKPKMHYNTSF